MKKRIFIANGDADDVIKMQKFFTNEEFEATTTYMKKDLEGDLLNTKDPFEFVVLSTKLADLNMPDFCKQLKSKAPFEKTNIIISLKDDADPKPYEDIGITAFIDEPYTNEGLKRKIHLVRQLGTTALKVKEESMLQKMLPIIIVGAVVLVCIIFLIKLAF